MARYKLINKSGWGDWPIGFEIDTEIKLNRVSPIEADGHVKFSPKDWELIEEPMSTEKKVIGYNLKKVEYKKAAESILGVPFNKETPGLVTVDRCIQDLKKAGVLDLWFEPIYEKSHPDITINGYKGEFFNWGVKFGCAEIHCNVFVELNKLYNNIQNKDIAIGNITNKNIESVTIGNGVFSKEQIKQIAEYYLNK